MTWMVLSLLLYLVVFSTAQVGENCDRARSYFDGILKTSVLNEQPADNDGVCGLPSSCCSARAMALLKEKVASDLKSAVDARIDSAAKLCSVDRFRGMHSVMLLGKTLTKPSSTH
jgi:hypothetical protein